MSFRIVAGLLFLAACSSATQSGSTGSNLTGGNSPQLAVDQFLRAARAGDLQAMSAVWGTRNGPARETMDRSDMEKRETILACYFNSDAYRILGETPGRSDHREVRVELRKGNLVRQSTFYAIQGPGGRWYVDDEDIAAVRDFCGNSGMSGSQ